jgi:hypothetical protein
LPDYDPALNKDFAMPYREIYYSFQHPYFIGYLYFWLLVFINNTIYLGLANFSSKRLLLRIFFLQNSLVNFMAYPNTTNRDGAENKF